MSVLRGAANKLNVRHKCTKTGSDAPQSSEMGTSGRRHVLATSILSALAEARLQLMDCSSQLKRLSVVSTPPSTDNGIEDPGERRSTPKEKRGTRNGTSIID